MKRNKPVRIDPDFEFDMRKLAEIRVNNKLARMRPNEISVREMTNLLRRTKGFQMSIEELKFKPKKEK